MKRAATSELDRPLEEEEDESFPLFIIEEVNPIDEDVSSGQTTRLQYVNSSSNGSRGNYLTRPAADKTYQDRVRLKKNLNEYPNQIKPHSSSTKDSSTGTSKIFVQEKVGTSSSQSFGKIVPTKKIGSSTADKGIKYKIQENFLTCSYCSGKFSMNILLEHLKVCKSNPKLIAKRKSIDNSYSSSNSNNKFVKIVPTKPIKIMDDDDEEQDLPPVLEREPEFRRSNRSRSIDLMPVLTPAIDILKPDHPPPSKKEELLKQYDFSDDTDDLSDQECLNDPLSIPETQKRGEEKGSCHICGKIFSRVRDVKRHVERSHSEKTFVCALCSKAFVNESRLEYHLSHAHANNVIDKLYQCAHCSQFFARQEFLVEHLKSHNCSSSQNIIKSNSVLLPKQSGKGSYPCQICPRIFHRKESLKSHMTIHTKTKTSEYNCDVCRAAFSRQSDKTKHARIHENEKPLLLTKGTEIIFNLGNVNLAECPFEDESAEPDDIPMIRISEVKSLANETEQTTFMSSSTWTSVSDDPDSARILSAISPSHEGDNANIAYYFCESPNHLDSDATMEDDAQVRLRKRTTTEYFCPECDESFLSDTLLAAHVVLCSSTEKSNSEYVNVFELLTEPEDEEEEEEEIDVLQSFT